MPISTARLTELAEAIQTDLAAASLTQVVTVERRWLPRTQIPTLSTSVPLITVWPAGETPVIVSRSKVEVEYKIALALRAKLADVENATLDPLITLLQELADYYQTTDSQPTAEERWTKSEVITADPAHLDKLIFFGAVTYTLVGYRP